MFTYEQLVMNLEKVLMSFHHNQFLTSRNVNISQQNEWEE